MKKTLLILMSLFFALQIQAQTSGGPDAYGYVWRDNNDPNGQAYSWVDLKTDTTAILVSGLADDNAVGPFNLPSDFPYYWYTVDKFWIGSNGYISFGNINIASPFPVIPNTALPHNFIAALLSDLNFTGTANPGTCRYKITSGNDSLIVSWDDVPFWSPNAPTYTGQNSFQIILNYNDSSILMQYKDQNGTTQGAANFAGVGIENLTGTIGLEWGHDLFPAVNTSIKYFKPSTTTLQINDASTLYNLNVENAGIFIPKNGAALPLSTEIKNSGNTNLNTFNVSTLVRNAANQIQVTNTTQAGPLNAGLTQVINQPNPFNPLTAGIYRVITDTQLSGDATPSNNQKITEVNVVDTTLIETELAYENGVEAGAGGLSWTGGDGGAAMYFIPPYYPCDVTKVKAFIISDNTAVGYFMKVYDDTGINNSPGALLDSIFVAPGITYNVFTTTILTAPLRINSGGFYVTWYMAGPEVVLGQSGAAPFSNRSFEVLSTTFAPYRSAETLDHMIRAVIARVGVGIDEISSQEGVSQFYPNPSSSTVTADIDLSILKGSNVLVSIYDNQGKLVSQNSNGLNNDRLSIDVKNYNAGIYLIRIGNESKEITRKFTVIK